MRNRAWYQLSEPQWALVAVLLFFWLAGGIGYIEGRVFPAASQMSVIRLEPANNGRDTDLYGHAERLRAQCNFRRLEWFKGARADRNVPTRVDVGPAEVRPNGTFKFGPWRISDVPPSLFYTQSYADVIHRCSISVAGITVEQPWLTRSRFWN